MTIQISPPVITHLHVSPLSAPGGSLFEAQVVATGFPSLRFAYQWHLDGAPVAGATDAGFLATAGGSLSVTVVAMNSHGSDTRTSAPAQVGPGLAAPEIERVEIVATGDDVGSMFRAVLDARGVPVPTIGLQWIVDGRIVPGATGPAFTPNAPGELVVRVSAANSEGIAYADSLPAQVRSAALAPSVAEVRIAPAHGRVGETFSGEAVVTGEPSPRVFFQWYLDGFAVEDATEQSHVPAAPGLLTLVVRAVSDVGAAERESAGAEVEPALRAPQVRATDLAPAAGRVGDTFRVTAKACGHPQPELSYAWFLEDVEIPGAHGETFTATAPGTLFARVTARNSEGEDSRETGAVEVEPLASAPVIERLSISGGGGTVGDVFEADLAVTGEPEPAIAFSWYLDGARIEGATASTLVLTEPGLLVLRIRATNAAGEAVAETAPLDVEAPVVPPVVHAPVIEAVRIEPAAGEVGDAFRAVAAAGGEPAPVLSYRWLLDGEAVTEASEEEHVARAAGMLSVEVTATSEGGNARRTSEAVQVAPKSVAPRVEAARIEPAEGRVGQTFAIDIEARGEPEPELSFVWMLDGEVLEGESAARIDPPRPGLLLGVVTASNRVGTDLAEVGPARVLAAQTAPIIRSIHVEPAAGPIGTLFRAEFELEGDPAPEPAFAWLLDGAVLTDARDGSYLATEPGALSVRLTASSSAGRAEAESPPVVVEELPASVFARGVFQAHVFA